MNSRTTAYTTHEAAPHTARAALARLTADTHERLHRLDCFRALMAGTIDRGGYVALLRRLRDFHRPLEEMLVARRDVFARFGIDIDAHRRADRLRADLHALGIVVDAGDGRSAGESEPLRLDSAGLCFGALYVREGATLGGRVLARRLDLLFGEADAGRKFLQGEPGDGARWSAVCEALDRVAAADPDGLVAMAEGATRCFEAFERHMTQVPT